MNPLYAIHAQSIVNATALVRLELMGLKIHVPPAAYPHLEVISEQLTHIDIAAEFIIAGRV